MQELTGCGVPLGLQCVGSPKGVFNIYGKSGYSQVCFLHSSACLWLCLLLISELGLLSIGLQLAIFVTESQRRLKRMEKRMLAAGGNAEGMCVLRLL